MSEFKCLYFCETASSLLHHFDASFDEDKDSAPRQCMEGARGLLQTVSNLRASLMEVDFSEL
jgi:hypothetical protein